VTGQIEPEDETADRVDLGSFPQASVVVVFGAGGGIGGALVEAVQAAGTFKHVVSFSRSTNHQLTGNVVFSLTETGPAKFAWKETKAIQRSKVGALSVSEVRSV
jgi:hypothetical protein